jgi:hypothetical protein
MTDDELERALVERNSVPRIQSRRLSLRPISAALRDKGQTALNERERTGEGVRGIAKRFGVDASTVQRIARPFVGAVA